MPDPNRAPLTFHCALSGGGAGFVAEVFHDPDGFYYMYRGRHVDLPGRPCG